MKPFGFPFISGAIGALLVAGLAAAAASAEPFSWQQPHAKVLPTGDLE